MISTIPIAKTVKVNDVRLTNDLTVFKEIMGNRPPNPQHVSRLASSIERNGLLQNPILVNENMEVIDGQHRLLAAKKSDSSIYYIIVKGYTLDQVQILNLNQKNWSKKDFMEGYADMGKKPYIKLRNFMLKNKGIAVNDCISLCSSGKTFKNFCMTNKYRKEGTTVDIKQVFVEGTWEGDSFHKAQDVVNKLKKLEPYYDGYKRSTFIRTMIHLLGKEDFIFSEFLHKVQIQPMKLVDCTKISQYKILIEEIYNYRRKEKVNLRY